MAGTDIGVNFAGGLAVDIVKGIRQQARYCYRFNKLITDLGDGQKNLMLTRDDMQRQFDKDKANSKEPSGDLQLQLKAVNELIGKVDKLKEKAESRQSCCHGVCPNLICRYFVGKKAEEKVKAIEKLNDELRRKLLSAYRLSLRCIRPSEDFILFKCTQEARSKVFKALEDDSKIRIGLCGMGGCGKTSLLRKVHKEVEDSKRYKTAFVIVSNPPNYQAIQDSIANWIGLVFETEKNVQDRAARLSMAFQKDKKYLIILDNVWRILDFEAIGIPVGENCKVLLSTRQRHLFDFMKFDAGIYLSLLTKDEAWQLFQKHAGEIKDPSQKMLAREIADECSGLPVAIKAMASTLRCKEKHVWINALETLKDRREPLKIDQEGLDDTYRCLKYSFDELKDPKEVSLFLLCALFPSDSEIAIEVLIRFAFGLGIFKDINSYQRARSKVRTAIDKFKDYCLLLQEGEYVKLHDMFHALALWEANNKTQVIMEPSQIVALTKEVYMKYTNRLYCHGIEEFPDQLNCPELEILIVSNNGLCSPKFLNMLSEMMKLKVFVIKNTSVRAKPNLVLPRSMKGLKKLRTLCLRGWTLINISMFEKLEMLDTLELLDCVIEELPKELANMKALKLLEVSNCKVGGDPYKVVATCSHLEELYFVDNDFPEMVQLTGQINVTEFFRQIGSFKVLQRYHLGIGGSINTSKDHSSSKLVSINNFDASSITNKSFQALSHTLEVLFFEKIQGDCKSIIPDMFPIQDECLNELKEFVLHDSGSIKYLIDTTNHQLDHTGIIFAKLQKLKVESMKCLEALCHGPPPSALFDCLKELFVKNCNQLASLFTTTTAQKMVMLEVLEVIDCDNLRYMIKVENEGEDISVGSVLPSLKQISVKRCENLKCVLPVSVTSGLLQLETLEVEDVVNLQYVFGYDNNEKDQHHKPIHIDLSAVKLKLINLPTITSICPRYNDIKRPWDKPIVTGCPRLSGILGLDSEVKQQDGDEAMEQLLSLSSDEGLKFKSRVRTLKDLVHATARKTRYFYGFNAFVTDLSREKDFLKSKIEGIIVSAWPSQQQGIVEEARGLIEEVEMLEHIAEASKRCCNGVFPNWLSRYVVGKRLEQMTITVKQFKERLPMKPHRVLSQPTITTHYNNVSMFESRRGPYNEILVALKDDEIYMIGLCGMAGCGKTTLIKEVGREAKISNLFDWVVMVTVSQCPDVRKIQGEIADMMALALEEESEIGRARRLKMRLNIGERILIILDDIWQKLDLEEVGIPLGENCKVVLTTRHQHLCTIMDCQKMVYLSILTEYEAWILFQEHAGVIQDTLKDLALQISRKCQGLPLAIVIVAKALKNQPIDVWKDSRMRLRDPLRGGMDGMEQVHQSVQLSTDFLMGEARSLFFLCALFPEDSNIALEILIRFTVGLGIFYDVDSYEIARLKVAAIIHKLIDSSLLLQLGDAKRQYFRMHNLVRNATFMSERKIQVTIGPEINLTALAETHYMRDTRRLYCHGIKEYPNHLNCPNLEFLFISNDSGCSSEFPNTFFIVKTELKVLAIIDTSIWTTPILLLPRSMDGLKQLRTVCFRGWTLKNISILGKLKRLDTIELLYCVIKELPEELAELTRLRLLEVSGCKIGSNPFEVLTKCSQLEELYFIENSLPEMVSNDHNVVKLLHHIGSSKVLRRYNLEIGSSVDTLENDLITKFISVNGFTIPTANEEMKNVAQKLEVLFLENVQGDCKNIFPHMIPMDGECMNELTEFLLHDSDHIECLIDTTNHPLYQATTTVFSRLLKLKIKTMKCFKALCLGQSPLDLFGKLEELFIVECSQLQCIISVGELNFCNVKHLKLEDCPKLTSVFTYSTAQTMVSLKILKVRDCISLNQIVKDEEEDEITPVGPIFPKLKQVIVKGCPRLEFIIPASFHGGLPQLSIVSDSEVAIQQGGGKSRAQELELPGIQSRDVVVQSVEDIPVDECNMEGIFQLTEPAIDLESKSVLLSCLQSLVMENLPYLRYIHDGHKQLLNLRRVRIYKCAELKCIFSLRMMTFISALRELIIEDCSQLEQIIEHDYYDGQYTGPFSEHCNLQKIIVKSCPLLGSLFTVSTAKTLRVMRTLKIEECPGMKVILKDGKTEAYRRKEIVEEDGGQAIFPNLSFLSLENLPGLIHVCEGGKFKAMKGVLFPESFNLSNLQSLTVQSCPRLRSFFTLSTAKTLMWLNSLVITDCSGLEHVIRGKSKVITQGDVENMLPKLNILLLVKLPSLIIIHRGIKLRFELCHVDECPKLKQTLADDLKADDLLQDYESPEEDYRDGDDEDMDRREEQHKEVEYAILEDNNNVNELKSSKSFQESKEVDGAAVGYPSVDSLSPTLAIHQDKDVPSHTGLTHSNDDRDNENKTGNSDIPCGSIATAADVHPHSQESEIVDTQEGLQNQKFGPDGSMKLRELLIDKEAQVVIDPQQALQDYRVLSPSTCIPAPSPTSEALFSSSIKQQEELADFQGLARHAHWSDAPHHQKRPEYDSRSEVQEAANIHVQSHTGLTYPNEDRDTENQRGNNDIPRGSIAAGSNFQLLKQDGTAAEVDPQEGLQKQKLCAVDSMNLLESNMEIAKLRLHKDPASDESTVGTSSQVMIDKQAQVVTDPQQALQDYKVPRQQKLPEDDSRSEVKGAANILVQSQNFDIISETHESFQKHHFYSVGSINLRESNKEITKGSLHSPKESTRRNSSLKLIDKPQVELVLPQVETYQQEAFSQNNVLSLPQPVHLTLEAPTSSSMKQHSIAEELADFHGIARRTCLLEEAFVKYPHLWNWKIAQKSSRFCKWGYESLTDMLELLKSEKPKTMDDSKGKKFEDLCLELESFGFDKEWLTSIRQRVMAKQVNHSDKLKQLVQLKSDVSGLEDQLNDARARMNSIEHDLSELDDVFDV